MICRYVDDDGEVHYDCGRYCAIDDTLNIDLQEALCTTPFLEYERWSYVEDQ